MRLYLLIFLFSFNLFCCPEGDIYSKPKLKPNFEILTQLRDTGANTKQALKEISFGNNHLTPDKLVNWDQPVKEQLMLFSKYLRKAIHRKHLGFKSISNYEKPREAAIKYFSDQVNAYHRVMYSNRKQWDFNNVINDVEVGETLYFIKDMQNSEHGIQINYKREYGDEEFIKPLFIMSHITYSGSIPNRVDGRKARVMMRIITPAFWKDKNYQLWELYLKPVQK